MILCAKFSFGHLLGHKTLHQPFQRFELKLATSSPLQMKKSYFEAQFQP